MSRQSDDEVFRDDGYAEKYQTRIFDETPREDNPYCESDLRCRGYQQLELIENLNFAEYLYLLVRGQLPSNSEAQLLNRALIAFSNPGVRHPATRAAVAAGVGKTLSPNVLPAALLVMSGDADGAGAIEPAMRFFRQSVKKDPQDLLPKQFEDIPAFGLHYGSENHYLDNVCGHLIAGNDWLYLQWGQQFISEQRSASNQIGWKQVGLAAAAFCDLGVMPKFGASLYQLMTASGLLAQGLENANMPPTVLPFVRDEDYQID